MEFALFGHRLDEMQTLLIETRLNELVCMGGYHKLAGSDDMITYSSQNSELPNRNFLPGPEV